MVYYKVGHVFFNVAIIHLGNTNTVCTTLIKREKKNLMGQETIILYIYINPV